MGKKMFIWRLEDDEGQGIYNNWENYFIRATLGEIDYAADPNKHPNPLFDQELGYYDLECLDEWFFGFASLSQMRNWVYRANWRHELNNLGVRLRKYEVDAEYYRRSNFQAIFLKEHARLIETRDVDYADK